MAVIAQLFLGVLAPVYSQSCGELQAMLQWQIQMVFVIPAVILTANLSTDQAILHHSGPTVCLDACICVKTRCILSRRHCQH